MPTDTTPFDRVYRGVFKGIYEGRLLPGKRLSAPGLMEEFGVGRGTVREAINRLLAVGVVTMTRNHSATVRMFSRDEMLDLLDVAGALLRLAAQRAGRKIDAPGARARISDSFEEIRTHILTGDIARFALAREAYYRAILAIGGNNELIRLFPSIHVQLIRLQLREDPVVAQSARLEEFQVLNRLLLGGDPIGAGDAAAMHVWSMTNAIGGLPDHFFQPVADARAAADEPCSPDAEWD